MKKFWQLIRTTFVGGVVFLGPVVLFIIIIEKALALTKRLVDPLVAILPLEDIAGFPKHRILGLTILALICLLAGFLAKTKRAQSFIASLEDKMLSKIPGYSYYKQTGESMIGLEKNATQPVVLAYVEEAWQIAFLTEKLDNGMLAVFIPGAPNPWSGSVFFMTPDRIKTTTLTHAQALKILRQLGAGTKALLKDQL